MSIRGRTKTLIDGWICLLYTSDAADERSSVDLGGRRIIKKKKNIENGVTQCMNKKKGAEWDHRQTIKDIVIEKDKYV